LLFFVLTLFYFLFSSFLLLKESNIIYQSITTLQKLQFPWRFLSTVVFSSAILGAFSIYILNKRYQKMVLLLLVLLTLGLSFPYWKTNGYFQKGDKFFSNIYKGTTDTGESSPIWSIRFMEKSAKATIEVISGEASFEKLQRKSTYHSYQVNVLSETARVRENTLYFPNWIVLVDGKETPIEFQDPANRGIITFYVSQGKHKVELLFKDTKLRTVSNVISFTSLLTLVLLFGFHLKLKYEKANIKENKGILAHELCHFEDYMHWNLFESIICPSIISKNDCNIISVRFCKFIIEKLFRILLPPLTPVFFASSRFSYTQAIAFDNIPSSTQAHLEDLINISSHKHSSGISCKT